MDRIEIEKRLDELKNCELIDFELGITNKIVYNKTVFNNFANEILLAECVYEPFSAIMPYCSITSIEPYYS